MARAGVRPRRRRTGRLRSHHLEHGQATRAARTHAVSAAGGSVPRVRGDPAPFTEPIRAAGVPLFCEVCDLEQARQAIDAGADVLVAQGGEAGGHGTGARSTLSLVPEVADLVAERTPATLVLAAGGIADGRGLAAALSLGADGVVVGTRLLASREAPVHVEAKSRVIELDLR